LSNRYASSSDDKGRIDSGVVEQVGRSSEVSRACGTGVSSLFGSEIRASSSVVTWLVRSFAFVFCHFTISACPSKIASASIGSSTISIDACLFANGFTAIISFPTRGSTVTSVWSNACSSIAFLWPQTKALRNFAIKARIKRSVSVALASCEVFSNAASSITAGTWIFGERSLTIGGVLSTLSSC